MATLTKINPSWIRSVSNRALETEANLVDGSALWKAGQFLRRASDGLLYAAATSASSTAASAITHYALQDLDSAIGADTSRLEVGIVHADDIWELHEKTGSVTEARKGQEYGMDVTSNVCTLDVTSVTYPVFLVVQVDWRDRPYQDSSSDTYGRLTARVLDTAINVAPTT